MHLNETEIILYTTQFGLTESQRQDVKNHLILCEECSNKQKQYSDKIQELIHQNELECQAIEEDMADFLTDALQPSRQHEIEKHLEECDDCHFLYRSLKDLSLEQVEETQETRVSITEKISVYIEELKKSLGTIANLVLEPLPPAPAFLGEEFQLGLRVVSHEGGNLCVNTQIPFQNVSVFSSANLELKTLQTDEFGVVVFNDFLRGKYKLGVEGFEVTDVQFSKIPSKKS